MERQGSGRRRKSGSERRRPASDAQPGSDAQRGRSGSGQRERARRRETSLVLSASPAGGSLPAADSGRLEPPAHDPTPPSDEPLRLPQSPDSWLDSLDAPSSADDSAAEVRARTDAPPAVGAERRLGRYQILETIGKGGYGRVYKAWDPQLEREVAIKVLLRTDVNAYRRFAREIKVTARLRHPNIVAVYDSGAAHGLPYLVMDYVEGRSLWEVGKSLHELPPLEAARLMSEVAQAIAHAHAQGILHRDIKPANVIVSGEGKPYVVDFGLARTEEMDRLTQTGAVLGTPLFMPLEQARARQQVDELCDVYALGASLYYALTGRPPHVAESLKELMAEMAQLPDPPSALNPQVTPALDEVCLRALQPDRARRTPNAAALAAELEAIVRGAEPCAVAGQGRQMVEVARQGVRALRRAVRGREKLILTSGYAAVVTILCASMLLRGRAPATPAAPESAATAPALAAAPESAPAGDLPARAAQTLARAAERCGRDLERQARTIEAEGPEVAGAAVEALRRAVQAGEPTPDAQALGLLGTLLARRGPEEAVQARPLLERAVTLGPDRVELLFWRGVALASAGDATQAERDWVLARERGEERLQDLRLAHQESLLPAARALLLKVAGLPAEGLPQLRAGVAPPAALERARALAGQLPQVAREDLASALTRAAEGKRWSDVALGLKRLELWAKDSPLAAMERARLAVGRGRVPEAQQALVRARELGADGAALDRLGADLLWRQGRRVDAVAAAAVVARRERGAEGRAAGALVQYLSARPADALAEADLGLAQEPDHVPCLLLRSLALAETGEPWSALGAARRAWELVGLQDELVAAAWIRAQTAIVLASGDELSQGHVVNAWLGFQTLLGRCEGAFPRLLLARVAVNEPALQEWAAEWLDGAAQRAPRAAEVPLLRGAMALAGGESPSVVDEAWAQARSLSPDARVPAGWAARYRERTGQEPPLAVE